ncbi:hypothetical protein [Prevotella sp. P3-92]|uniref:hypothetical protein n=1 Tax=Prevotella sp. P3-92 TaxID=2024221 RepID=UPI0011871D89|nr:hypothetical protein [Prevotella sp. P3-92]
MPTRNYRQLDDLPPSWLAEHPSATTNQHTAPHPTPAEADSSTTAPLKHSHGESSLFHPFCTPQKPLTGSKNTSPPHRPTTTQNTPYPS